MISFEKISIDKIKVIADMMNSLDNIRYYKLDFIDFYSKKNKLTQFFYRKNIYLIKYNHIYIGYVWFDISEGNSLKILDLYVNEKYYNVIDKSILLSLNKKRVYYECLNSEPTTELFTRLGLNKIDYTNLYMINTKDVIIKKRVTDATFRKYILTEDSAKRCDMQNIIFNSDDRVLLIPGDILLEEKQDFYIKDLCIFIRVNGIEIGYGQVIHNRGVCTIVNFGILEEYRNQGYGADLLLVLIELSKLKGIDTLYIRVDYNNKQAIALYESVGFKFIGDFCIWELESTN